MAASQTLQPPPFPFTSLRGSEITLQDIINSPYLESKTRLDPLVTLNLTIEMENVFEAIRAYTSIIDSYQEGSLFGVDESIICDQRNLVQWHIIALPPASQFIDNFLQSHPIYEACRLSVMIFGVGVTFPLPAKTTPLSTLARLLQIELQQYDQNIAWISSPVAVRVLFWVFTLGGIAATGTFNRKWFVSKLKKLALLHGLTTWDDLRPNLKSVLWLDCACDVPGEQLWNEVMK
jgi:hypothetical protein